MAISSLIPELWAAALYTELNRANIWTDMITDISGETVVGNKINIGNLSTTPTVRDYTKNTALVAPEDATDAETELTLDQQKYFNIMVHDIDEVQTRPAIMTDWARKASVAINETIDSFLYSTWTGGSFATANTVALAEDELLKADLSTSDANIAKYANALLQLTHKMDVAKWPTTGRWCVVPPKGKFYLVKWLVDKGRIGTGQTNQDALVNAALDQVFGMTVRMSLAFPDTDTASKATGNIAVAGINSGVYYAQQISEVEAFRPETHFADAVRGLFVYGAARMDNTRRAVITETAS